MELMDATRSRRSIRSYLPRPVEDGKLLAVLEARRIATLDRQHAGLEIRGGQGHPHHGQVYVVEAPVIIVACGTSTRTMPNGIPTFAVDVSIAVDHMTLATASLGLGTCWIGAFNQDKVKEILGIPKGVTVVALLPQGYPASVGRPTPPGR